MATQVIDPPTSLNKEFIQQTMRKALNNENWVIISCDIKSALGPGENFGSIIFRANLVVTEDGGKNENMSLIMKSLPPGESIQETVHDLAVFSKEGTILFELIPAMEKLVPKTKGLTAKCYFFQGPPNDLIILEDLRTDGFKLADRIKGFNLDESSFIVKNMAALHAGMRVLVKHKPEIKEDYKHSFWSSHWKDKTIKMFQTFEGLAEEAKKWEDFPTSIAQKLVELATSAQKKENELFVIDENFKLNTLIHGDCWVNNMMMKYDSDGKVIDHRFLDFQISSYNSAILDLIYFLFTSVKHEIRKEYLETIKRVYYDELTSILTVTEPELVFTYEEFEKEYKSKLFHGVTTSVLLFPVMSALPKDAMDADKARSEGSGVNNYDILKNERVKFVLKELLPYFDQEGAFNLSPLHIFCQT